MIPVVIGYSLIAWIAAYFQEPPSPHGLLYPDPRKPWEAGAPYTLYGLPTAYLCMIFVGIPAHYLASKMNLVRIWFALLTAAIATVLASWFYFSGKFHPGFTCFLFVNSSAIALVFYAIARPRSKKPKGSNL